MSTNPPFSVFSRLRSFKYAFSGLALILRTQHNAWIHACATLAVIALGFFFQITKAEWCWIIIVMVVVWITEALNTAIELLSDAAVPDLHPLIRNAKDVAAGAVLLSAVGAFLVGCLVFLPHIFGTFSL